MACSRDVLFSFKKTLPNTLPKIYTLPNNNAECLIGITHLWCVDPEGFPFL